MQVLSALRVLRADAMGRPPRSSATQSRQGLAGIIMQPGRRFELLTYALRVSLHTCQGGYWRHLHIA
jgi:hypothetical protein